MVRITAAELAATQAKLATVNKRATKRGFTGRIDLAVEQVEVKSTDDFGFERTDIMFDVALSGEAPCYEGWRFIATLDWDEHAGLIVRSVPGVEDIDRTHLSQGWCDHCHTRRYRKETYLVQHEDGRQVQVGSSCIKDFLGHNVGVTLLYADDLEGELGFGGFGASQPDAVDTRYALAVAWALIKLDGYRSAGGYGATTKGDVTDVLWPPSTMNLQRRQELARIRELATEAMGRADECIHWALKEWDGDGTYATNLRAVLSAEYVTIRNIGILASAPQTWAKSLTRTLVREAAGTSEWLGKPGDKVSFTATINSISYIDTAFGATTLYTMQTPEGNVVKWFSSRGILGERTGITFTLSATIKATEEFRGTKQTLVTRAKVLATVNKE